MEQQFKTEINKLLNRFKKSAQDLTPVLQTISVIINNAIDVNFAQLGRWNGNAKDITLLSGGTSKWKALAPSTVKAYAKKGWETTRTLYRSGEMRRSTEARPRGKTGIIASSNRPYSRIQQLGGKAGRNLSATIPPSPYMVITQEDLDEIIETIKKYVFTGG